MTTTLILGCGYLGRRVASQLLARGDRVLGTARSESRGAELRALGIEPVLADVLDPTTLRFSRVDRVFACIGFDRSAGVPIHAVYVDGLRNALAALPEPPERLVYASSTGVYGQTEGDWVDEEAPAVPLTDSGRACLEAEGIVLALPGSVVLRYSGLYGPGRIIRRPAVERGEPIVGDPDRTLNVIHIDDAANAAVAALDRGEPGRIYLASDDRPVARREYYGRVAEYLKAPTPRFVPPGPDSPEARREGTNKRISNRRLREELGVTLAYPDIATGIPAAMAGEGG